jgi:tetratricopeptide (TPR) repeat protein
VQPGNERPRDFGRLVSGVTILLLGVGFIAGCSILRPIFGDQAEPSAPKTATEPTDQKRASAARNFKAKAAALQQQGEWPTALSYLRVAQALDPGDEVVGSTIESLRAACRRESEKYLERGLQHYQQKQLEEAQRCFLIVLRYDPDNQKALYYLTQKLLPSNYQAYKVKPGDTLKQVAREIYQDPGKDFLVAYFNDLKPGQEPVAGAWLKLPYLEAEFAEPFFDIPGELALGRQLLAQERYGDALGIAGKILDYDYLNKDADELKNAAYYQMGLHLLRQEKYDAAVQMLSKVDPEHAGVAEALQRAHAQELQKAEKLLHGQSYDEALARAQHVLTYDPANPVAPDLINRIICRQGQSFIEKQKYREAALVLSKGDPNHECIASTSASIKAQLQKQAEVHYLQGVKCFLNEDLQHAIVEWEATLALDPEHEKAQLGIQNARHLMEQLEKVEKK